MTARSQAKNKKRREQVKAAHKALGEANAFTAAVQSMIPAACDTPVITEDDLLDFQFSHFGDDSKPNNWFVNAETALDCHTKLGHEEDDDELGYYEDGVKRTLTDEQIAMFRHSEIHGLLRERRLQREADGDDDDDDLNGHIEEETDGQQPPKSPLSDASSIERDLFGLARPGLAPAPRHPLSKRPPEGSRSSTSQSSVQPRRRRKHDIPYDQRHKRKWERYIEEEDPLEGSRTHRRLVREMDEQAPERTDVDYGDDVPPVQKSHPSNADSALPGRPVVSYAED